MFDFIQNEEKWQKYWEDEQLFSPDLHKAENPFYNLMMFPYPSSHGLHMGHAFTFSGVDVYGRYMQLNGYDVFQPFGYDAFGIHSENYAIKVNKNPKLLIPEVISNFKSQVKKLGLIIDWKSELSTTDETYYKWTQWLFVQLYKNGLAYKKESNVNWCDSCKTVLADEQVVGGQCERCDSLVKKKKLSQWFLKITKYIPELLKDLEWIDWADVVKKAQTDWIGKSDGVELDFETEAGKLRVFTTRLDTLCGATFMALAYDHEMVPKLLRPQYAKDYELFVETINSNEDKKGLFTGSYAINPINGEKIPIWLADYVLSDYGFGAIMAVPAHDSRDYEFAKKYALPIKQVITSSEAKQDELYEGKGELVNSYQYTGMSSAMALEAMVADLASKGVYAKKVVTYKMRDWCVSRQRFWGPPIPIVYCETCGMVPEESLPVKLPDIDIFIPDGSGLSPLARAKEFVNTICPRCKGHAKRDTDVLDNFLDSAWYFLRYPSNGKDEFIDKTITKKWLPVSMYIGGREHSVLHLMYTRFIIKALADIGILEFREPFRKFRVNGLITKDGSKMSKSKGNVVDPLIYLEEYGSDILRMHLLFIGPFSFGGEFREDGILGVKKFLLRLLDLKAIPLVDNVGYIEQHHRYVKKITEDIESLNYNTAIAALMEYYNLIKKNNLITKEIRDAFVIMLSPLAPHFAENLWHEFGYNDSIFKAKWPSYDVKAAMGSNVTVAVQINGKLRDTLLLPRGLTQEDAKEAAFKSERIKQYLEKGSVKKIIWVQDRIINIVVG